MRQPPAPSDSRRSVAPPPGTGEGAPTVRPSLPAAAPLLSLGSRRWLVSVSARPESQAEALMESRADALSERVKESRRTRVDMRCGGRVARQRKCQLPIVSYEQDVSCIGRRRRHGGRITRNAPRGARPSGSRSRAMCTDSHPLWLPLVYGESRREYKFAICWY